MSKIIKPVNLLFLYVILNLVVGLFIVPDYGFSTDEPVEFRTADVALMAYSSKPDRSLGEKYEELRHDRYYGTASTGLIRFIERDVLPDAGSTPYEVAHFGYFLFFQAAIVAVFLLGSFFLDGWGSLGVALLFGTQPLLFGHAFINPKDIPLLTSFLFALVTGWMMVDRWRQAGQLAEPEELEQAAVTSSRVSRVKKERWTILVFIVLFMMVWSGNWVTGSALKLVEYSYKTQATSIAGKLFSALTSQGKLEDYLNWTQLILTRGYRWLALAAPVLLLLFTYYAQRKRWFGGMINLFGLLAAAIWGVAVSTRVLAVAAGGLVGLYALSKLRGKAILPLIFYTLSASIFSYASWPFLWVYGLRGYLDALTLFKDFPWSGQVLFEGQLYDPTNLPARYLPKLMLLQFTEPLVVLALVGFLVSLYLLFKKEADTAKLLLLYAWFGIPLVYTMFSDTLIYSNFRHFLFITPPIFIFAGMAFQQIALKMKASRWVMAILMLVVLLPGFYSIVRIHPYQYFYYNSFTGGIAGAEGSYELDYWNLAYKDAMDYVNEHVPAGSKILVWKNNLLGKAYARQEFTFTAHTSVPEQEYQAFDYAIMPVGRNTYADLMVLKDSPVVYSAAAGEVELLVVLKIPGERD